MIGIYKITSPFGKIYIGQSTNIIKRKTYYKHSLCKNQTKLYYSIKKYGIDKHIFEIIEECNIKELNNKERFWQDFYNCVKKGLNCRLTESDDKSGNISEETKNKIGKANTGKIHTKETREKISIANKGRKYGNEVRQKVSKNHARHNAKLSDEEVHIICKMYLEGNTTEAVRKKFPYIGVCSLSEIRNKKRYKHVTDFYNIKKPYRKGTYKKTIRKVLCIEDNIVFDGISKVGEYYQINFRLVSSNALKNANIFKKIKKLRGINKSFKYV